MAPPKSHANRVLAAQPTAVGTDATSLMTSNTSDVSQAAAAANDTARAAKSGSKRMKARWTWVSWLKLVVFFAALLPLVALVESVYSGTAGANPIETVTHVTGEWGLRFLLLGLMLTPLRWLFKSNKPIQFRRMIGLFAFFYVVLHLMAYAGLDQRFDVAAMFEDVTKRPYIIAGFVASLILLPLAITSTRGMMRRMGRHWKTLHKGVYIASIAAVLHFIWLSRGDQLEPKIYAAVLLGLLLMRVWRSYAPKFKRKRALT